MKEFKSHKTVKAAKIILLDTAENPIEGWSIALQTDDGKSYVYKSNDPMLARYVPVLGDYLVEYDGGYQSFSPAKAFEDGYAEIGAAPATMPSTSDARTDNNVMRHEYRILSDAEKADMQRIKDAGMQFHNMVSLMHYSPRELALAKTKIEEAVMWATKAITK